MPGAAENDEAIKFRPGADTAENDKTTKFRPGADAAANVGPTKFRSGTESDFKGVLSVITHKKAH